MARFVMLLHSVRKNIPSIFDFNIKKYYHFIIFDADISDTCRLQIFVIFCIFKYYKTGKFAASMEHPKARSVSVSGGELQ